MAFSSVITAIATQLQYVATTVTNPRKLGEANIRPPLYVWERQSIELADSDGLTKTRDLRQLGNDGHECVVHCWGATENDCESMRSALVVAIRTQLQGRNFKMGQARWEYPEWAGASYVLAQSVTFLVPLVAVEIPTEAGASIPSTDVTNDSASTVTLTTINPDSTDADDGDGYLQTAGEP
jgi:hypothetical protein